MIVIGFDESAVMEFIADVHYLKSPQFNEDFDQGNYFGADLVPEVGDIIMYYEGYYEDDNDIGGDIEE